MSLDAIDPEQNRERSRRDNLEATLATVQQAKQLGFSPLRVNCVAMQDTDFPAMVRWACQQGIHLRFIELMNIGEANPWHEQQFIDSETIRQRCFEAGLALFPAPELDAPTARVWTIPGHNPPNAQLALLPPYRNPSADPVIAFVSVHKVACIPAYLMKKVSTCGLPINNQLMMPSNYLNKL